MKTNTNLLSEAEELAKKLWDGPDRPPVEQKPLALIPKPADRPSDWIKYKVRVLFIVVDREQKVEIRTGHICSWPGSHGIGTEVDNVKETIIWSDQVLNPDADDADDAHETTFDPKDPHLLRRDEAVILSDPGHVSAWFDGKYSPEVVRQIVELASKPRFGNQPSSTELSMELKETAVA